MKSGILVFVLVLFSSFAYSQKVISQELYEGKIDGKIEIALYLKVAENGCPTIYSEGIYKYKSNKNKEWILFDITFSESKNQFTMVEHFNTGLFLFKRENNQLKGLWISPDGKKQLKVELTKVKINSKQIESLENALENENYQANDC
jgi:iron uptake system EfeUOB component EfeO/EfeM